MKKELTLEERIARGAIICGPGITEQAHKDACDINKIMAQYSKTGHVPVYLDMVPKSGDFSNVVDYHTACNLVLEAQESFNNLPAEVRDEFNHDPAEFLAACEDPAQRARLVKAGVIVEPEANLEPSDGSSPPEEGVKA